MKDVIRPEITENSTKLGRPFGAKGRIRRQFVFKDTHSSIENPIGNLKILIGAAEEKIKRVEILQKELDKAQKELDESLSKILNIKTKKG